MITKAIIPVAGWGTRRLPITKVIEKSMLPVGNRPLVDYSVQELAKAGVKDIYMIISNVEPCQVRAFYSENAALSEYLTERGKMDRLETAKTLPEGVNIHYLAQDTSKKYGTAIPVAMVVKEFDITEPVFVFMGDDFIWNPDGESAAETMLKDFEKNHESVIFGARKEKSELNKYGVLSEKDGVLTGIVEKPEIESAPSNLINVSKYIMTPALLDKIIEYVDTNHFSAQEQEYLITDPIVEFIKSGGKMRVVSNSGEYLDGGSVEGWLHANNVVLGHESKD